MFNFYNKNMQNQNSNLQCQQTTNQENLGDNGKNKVNENVEASTVDKNSFNFSNVGFKQAENSIGNRQNTTLNNQENFDILQRARKDLIGEVEAVIQYDEHIHLTTNQNVKNLLESIKNEEISHIGELTALVNYFDNTQKQYFERGLQEFKEIFKQ